MHVTELGSTFSGSHDTNNYDDLTSVEGIWNMRQKHEQACNKSDNSNSKQVYNRSNGRTNKLA